MKYLFSLITIFLTSLSLTAGQRETIWPKGRMPHRQDHQIAAMTDEAGKEGFDADRNRIAYIEWFDAPAEDVRNGGCMILISGGSYKNCCDVNLIKKWNKKFVRTKSQNIFVGYFLSIIYLQDLIS